MNKLAKTVYRTLWKTLVRNGQIVLIDKLHLLRIGTHAVRLDDSAYTRFSFMFPNVEIPTKTCHSLSSQANSKSAPTLSVEEAKALLRHNTRSGHVSVDDGFQHLRTLNETRKRMLCTSVSRHNDVIVEISTELVPRGSPVEFDGSPFEFMYRVRFHNQSDSPIKLNCRELYFREENGDEIHVPYGSVGVLGQTPTIRPGEMFQYYSGVGLQKPSAVMSGKYQFTNLETSDTFDVDFGPACMMNEPSEQVYQRMLRAHTDGMQPYP